MSADTVIVVVIVALAASYTIWYFVRKINRISKSDGCGGDCENCPFAKYGQCHCHQKDAEKGSGGCGCCK